MTSKIPIGHGKTRVGSVYLDLGGDGDQWIISPTKGGGIVVLHVPPSQPVKGQLIAAEGALVGPAAISSEQLSKHFHVQISTGQELLAGIAMLGKEGT
jgi:hypothetical protein